MKILFRCDSSYSIGSGHLVRCISLAQYLKVEVIFVCRSLSGNINSRVSQNQFKLIELPDIPDYQIGSEINELEEVVEIFCSEKPDAIIVDHYGLSYEWEKLAKQHSKVVITIDDIERKHSADAILDQNFRSYIPQEYINSGAELFLGPEFCLLNPSFLESKPPQRSFDKVNRILSFFGGSDLGSMTLRIIEISKKLDPSLHWDIVLGGQNQDIETIKHSIKSLTNVDLHVNISYMHELMAKADLFVGAGGSTTWERAKLGLPSIVISVAENQVNICKELADKDIIIYLGEQKQTTDNNLIDSISSLIENSQLRLKLSENSLGLKIGSKLRNLPTYLKEFCK